MRPLFVGVVLGLCCAVVPAGWAQTGCAPAPEGLISWWSGDGDASDVVGENDGTLVGNPTFEAGKVQRAFSLSGGYDEYVQMLAPVGLPLGSAPRTIMLWFLTHKNTVYDTESSMFQYGRTSDGQMFGLITSRNAPGKLYFWGWGWGHVDFAGTTTLQREVWYHAAVTYDGTTVRLYLNGALESSRNLTLNTVLDPAWGLTLGHRYDYWGTSWDGLLDEIGVFNRALTAGEIQTLYLAGPSGICMDRDGDGFIPPEDCDETDETVYPNAPELPGNFVDENCDGSLGPCDPCFAWRNHGEYVRCVAHGAEELVSARAFTESGGDNLVMSAAASDIGKSGYVSPECECDQVMFSYSYDYAGRSGTATLLPGSILTLYDEPGGGSRDIAECHVGADCRLRAYYHDAGSLDEPGTYGPWVIGGCSHSEEAGFEVDCCVQ